MPAAHLEPAEAAEAAAGGPLLTRARQLGAASWGVLGIIGLVVVAAMGISAVSGILIPLVVAVILGMVLEPVAAFFRRAGLPSAAAVAVTLVIFVLTLALTLTVVIRGFLAQLPEISRQLVTGWNSLIEWFRNHDLDPVWLERARTAFDGHSAQLGQGVLGAVTHTFYGAVSAIIGVFFALFFLFFAIRDGYRFSGWIARSTGLDEESIDAVVRVSRDSVRGYFRGTAITALLTAPIFMIPLLIMRIPLAIPIFILYFFLSFLPFVGAWITGAFAILIAFGAGGLPAALIIGATFVISNGTIQSAVSSWALGNSLQLHPVAVLLATIIGGTIAGLLGMVLGAPVLAAVVKSVRLLRGRAATADPGLDTRALST